MDRARVASGIGRGERAARAAGLEEPLERREHRGEDPLELGREFELEPAAFGPQHLGAPRPAGRVRERELLVDPDDERGLRVRRRVDGAVDPAAHDLGVGVEEGEQQLVLRREVPVERACRQAGLGQHLGDGEPLRRRDGGAPRSAASISDRASASARARAGDVERSATRPATMPVTSFRDAHSRN